MAKANEIKSIFNLVGHVERNTQQTFQESLSLSEKLQRCEEASPNKPPFAINYLEYYDSHEPVTSWIIRHIFAYSFNGRHPYFESFAQAFLTGIGFNPDWIDSPVIDKDHEYKSIDILIRDKQYAVIIENKLKGADFQLNQLARYIATMRNEGYTDEQIFVVVLPKYDIDNDYLHDSVWRLPKDWKSTNLSRKCRVDSHTCWCDYPDYKPKAHCKKCEFLKELFEERTLFIYKELSEWLFDCIENNTVAIPEEEVRKQYVLRSASLQFVDFLNSIYDTRENNKYIMDIQKFLNEQLTLDGQELIEQLSIVEDKQKEANELASQLENLYWNKINDLINEIGEKYKVHIVRDDDNDRETKFHCDIKFEDIFLILRVDNEGQYFCQLETKGKVRIPDSIMNDYDITEELNDKDNTKDCIWKYASYKESLLRFDRVLGRLLDIQKNS